MSGEKLAVWDPVVQGDGNGGVSIVDGRIYVPLRDGGIAVVAVNAGHGAAPPSMTSVCPVT